MFKTSTLFAGLAAAAALATGPAQAATVFFQDFSSGIGASETLSGQFTVGGGRMGHIGAPYANNELSFYQVALDLTQVTDALFSFDWTMSVENGWDGWNLLATESGTTFDPLHPVQASIYNHFISALQAPGVTGNGAGHATVDLSSFAGKAVDLRLQFASDYSLVGSGVTFDNLLVTGTSAPVAAVPEPATWAIMLAGFFGMGVALRQRRLRLA